MGTETRHFVAKAPKVSVQCVAGTPLPLTCPLKVLPLWAGRVPGISLLLQAVRRVLGKLYWWLFTLPSQYQVNHLSFAKAGAFETLQPTLHGAGLLGHPLCSMGFEPFAPGISRPALHRLSRTPCPLAGVLATPSVWFGVSEAEPCALGFA